MRVQQPPVKPPHSRTTAWLHRIGVLFVLVFLPGFMAAQPFEGSVVVQQYRVSSTNERSEARSLPLDISKDRIRVNGLNRADPSGIMNNMGASDLLIRLDKEDFVFLTTDQKAIILGKNELQLMVGLMTGNRNGQPAPVPAPPDIRKTTESQRLHGYDAGKWVVRQTDSTTEAHVWASAEFTIFWGMLAEPWVNNLAGLNILPVQDVLQNGTTPLKIESVRNNRVFEVLEVASITPKTGSRASLEIPANYQQMTFQEMMVNRMRGQ